MKIGILSMQKIHNYGSFLQALSLKMQMEARGHEVYFIDIEKGRQIVPPVASSASVFSVLKKFDRYFLKRIENYLLTRRMNGIHVSDYTEYLETDKVLPEGEKFDLVIIGSDEVFNATTPSPWGFSSQLFGSISNAKKVVTYAASCGHTDFDSAQRYGIVDELAEAMSHLSDISVRDENTHTFVKQITGKEALRHLDPVFISDYDSKIVPTTRRKPYLLVYAYVNRISDEKEIAAIRAYARENGLETVSVGTQQRWCDHNLSATGFELLSYVKNAACVVTDTFHGTVFSIKYNKKFAAFVRESNRNKLGGLLATFDLSGRAVADPSELGRVMDGSIDFDAVNAKIKEEKNRSMEYLDKICEG